jgi:hypothetical protein
MATDTKQAHATRKVRITGLAARAGYFLWHFLEMCVVMCAGAGILAVLARWIGSLIGYAEPIRRFPELSTMLLALWLSLLMLAWMRFRGHAWRPTLEMAGTSIVVLPLLISAAWLGIIAQSDLLKLECGLACVLMLVPMLLHLDHYTGHHASHHAHAAHERM